MLKKFVKLVKNYGILSKTLEYSYKGAEYSQNAMECL